MRFSKALRQDVGEQVEVIRKKRGLSRAQLSKRIFFSRHWLLRVEEGSLKNLTIRQLVRIAAALDCKVERIKITPNRKGNVRKRRPQP